jgi:hypothetical protein
MTTWLTIFCIGFTSRLLWAFVPKCEMCPHAFHRTTIHGLRCESSRTMYHWDGTGKDPNRSLLLCRQCAILHHDYWDEMWDQYNAGRL